MSRDSEFNSRKKRRYSKKRKMDKMLNILIGVVAVLIVVNLYFILTKDDDKDVAEENKPAEEMDTIDDKDKTIFDDENDVEDEMVLEDEVDSNISEPVKEPSKNIEKNNSKTNEYESKDNLVQENEQNNSSNEIIMTTSNDELVEQIIVNNDWKVTPTRQTGPHVSSFDEGHIDYEEKKLTIRNAVELLEDDIIYWSIRNDGTGKGAIAVVSSKDKEKKYRVHIKWIENAGWIPLKVEKLKQLEGTYEVMN